MAILYIVFTIILVILIALSALFSFSEMAISSSNKTRLLTIIDSNEHTARQKKKAEKVIYFTENYNEHITAIVIFNNIVNILFSTLATVFFTIIASEVWDSGAYGALLSFLVTTPLVIIFGEIIPKQLAKKYPEKGTMLLATAITFVNGIMKPFTFVLGKIIKEEDNTAFSSDNEINTAISQATAAGVTTEYEQLLIQKLLSADEKTVESIMVPIEEVTLIKHDITIPKLNALLKETSHTRFPIVDENNKVTAIFSTKNYLLDKLRSNVTGIEKYSYPFTTFSLDENPFHILEALRNRREKMAIILDDDDVFVGVITLEDIIELLVGEIYDETDHEKDGVYALNDTSFILDDHVEVGYWAKEYANKMRLNSEINKLSIGKWVEELKGGKPQHGDSLTYKNLIIWTRQDKTNKKKFVYEIDIV